MKYKVVYVYAPYPSVYFRNKAEAIKFSKDEIPATKVYKVNIFGIAKEIAVC
jgi:hypothetical protein